MPSLSLTELIDTEVLNTGGQYFRNYEICEATGASRQHVSQRMKTLYSEGVLEKHGRDWYVANQALLVTKLLRAVRSQELVSTKLLKLTGNSATTLLQAIALLQGSPNSWQVNAFVLEEKILEDIEESIETLRNMRSQLKSPPKSGKQIYAHMVNSGEYAVSLQKTFVEGAQYFLGKELDEEVITEEIRARALEREQNNG